MSLFLSSYENRLDTKGRVSVPASFRASLCNETFAGVVLFRSFTNNCIEGFSMSRMEQMATATDNMGVFDSELDNLSAMLFADARPLAFDVTYCCSGGFVGTCWYYRPGGLCWSWEQFSDMESRCVSHRPGKVIAESACHPSEFQDRFNGQIKKSPNGDFFILYKLFWHQIANVFPNTAEYTGVWCNAVDTWFCIAWSHSSPYWVIVFV